MTFSQDDNDFGGQGEMGGSNRAQKGGIAKRKGKGKGSQLDQDKDKSDISGNTDDLGEMEEDDMTTY